MFDVYIGPTGNNNEPDMMVAPIEEQIHTTTSNQLSSYEVAEIELSSVINEDPLHNERLYFESIRSDLLKDPEIKDDFVAILDNKVIGHGTNGADLAIEMYKEHGYVPILIEKVSEDITYTTSPRIEEL